MQHTYGIIGAGRLGRALAAALRREVAWVVNRGVAGRDRVRTLAGDLAVYDAIDAIADPPPCIILAVSDSAIEQQAALCAAHWGAQLNGCIVLHCSGALGREVLQTCADVGALTAAAHPFQTIAIASPEVFQGSAWGIDANDVALPAVAALVHRLGGVPVVLSGHTLAHKALYHAAASMAANYLTVLTAYAADLADAAGIPADRFLPPIMRTALENSLAALSEEQRIFPLTGPIARADTATVTRHLEQLRPMPHLLRAYCLFGLATVERAAEYGMIDESARRTLVHLLHAESGGSHELP